MIYLIVVFLFLLILSIVLKVKNGKSNGIDVNFKNFLKFPEYLGYRIVSKKSVESMSLSFGYTLLIYFASFSICLMLFLEFCKDYIHF